MEHLIEIKNMSFQYLLSETLVLDEITLILEPGKVYGITGLNGSGKTTLASIIRGFIPRFCRGKIWGEILLNGKPIANYSSEELTRKIGYVFQNPFNQISGVKKPFLKKLAIAWRIIM